MELILFTAFLIIYPNYNFVRFCKRCLSAFGHACHLYFSILLSSLRAVKGVHHPPGSQVFRFQGVHMDSVALETNVDDDALITNLTVPNTNLTDINLEIMSGIYFPFTL